MEQFRLIDDGTLDTVLECVECGEQLRFNPDLVDGVGDSFRIQVALGMAREDHEECG